MVRAVALALVVQRPEIGVDRELGLAARHLGGVGARAVSSPIWAQAAAMNAWWV